MIQNKKLVIEKPVNAKKNVINKPQRSSVALTDEQMHRQPHSREVTLKPHKKPSVHMCQL